MQNVYRVVFLQKLADKKCALNLIRNGVEAIFCRQKKKKHVHILFYSKNLNKIDQNQQC
jgi:hypothetical protein